MSGTSTNEIAEAAGRATRAVVPYERGLPLSSTVRATLTRFLPGAATSVVAGITLASGRFPDITAESVLVVGAVVGMLSLGYLVGLEALRRWLYPDAAVEGRRSFMAGLMAPIAAFITGVLADPAIGTNVMGFLFLPALVIAVVMFFAWLTPTPESMRAAEYGTPGGAGEEPEDRALP